MYMGEQEGRESKRENARREHREFEQSSRYCVYGARRLNLAKLDNEFDIITPQKFLELIADVKKTSKNQLHLRHLKNALAESDENRRQFIRSVGAVHGLVGSLCGNHVDCQLEAAGCLVNLLATDDHTIIKSIAKQTTPYFIQYIQGGSYPALKELSCLALGNIAADCRVCCDLLKSQDFFKAIKSIIDQPSSVDASALFALSCYMKNKPEEWKEIIESHLISPSSLCFNLNRKDMALIMESSKILFYLSTRPAECCQYLVASGITDDIVCQLIMNVAKCCSNGQSELLLTTIQCQIVTYLIRTLGNILATTDSLPSVLSTTFQSSNWNETLKLLLSSNYEHLTKETLWLIANITCFQPLHGHQTTWFNDTTLISRIANKLIGPEGQLLPAIECFCNILTLGPPTLAKQCLKFIKEDTLIRLVSPVNSTEVIQRTIILAHILLGVVDNPSQLTSFVQQLALGTSTDSKGITDMTRAFLSVHL